MFPGREKRIQPQLNTNHQSSATSKPQPEKWTSASTETQSPTNPGIYYYHNLPDSPTPSTPQWTPPFT
ncbi:hypothetical protein VTN49DRAFT_7784 [Thermomyces lanuginosus]|uniref:uncharacterized protein n=1 Tax=Thermomyces lanuginosus TaxID=5541 RepID=UPI00374202A0